MALSLQRLRAPTAPTRISRRPVVVRANLMKDLGSGFAQIFTPLLSGSKDVPKVEGSYSGEVPKRAHKPFADNWAAPVTPKAQAEEAKPAQAPAADSDPVEYVNKAAEHVVRGSWKGEVEPDAWAGQASSVGWKGDIHTRRRDGFHSMKPATQPPKQATAAQAAKEEEAAEDPVSNVVTFLNDAAANVVAHNFKGDKTEPEAWSAKDQTPTGWSTSIHTRKREGFHSFKD